MSDVLDDRKAAREAAEAARYRRDHDEPLDAADREALARHPDVAAPIMLHAGGKAIGVLGPDGQIRTHNMTLAREHTPNWRRVADCPAKLAWALAAARARLRNNL